MHRILNSWYFNLPASEIAYDDKRELEDGADEVDCNERDRIRMRRKSSPVKTHQGGQIEDETSDQHKRAVYSERHKFVAFHRLI